jgi:hypothetical protein
MDEPTAQHLMPFNDFATVESPKLTSKWKGPAQMINDTSSRTELKHSLLIYT